MKKCIDFNTEKYMNPANDFFKINDHFCLWKINIKIYEKESMRD